MAIRIVDVTDDPSFRLVPPCADPGFDHRSCDYWEDADRGSKAARLAWPAGGGVPASVKPALRTAWRAGGKVPPPMSPARATNPFPTDDEPAFNPFAPASRGPAFNPFA